MRRSILIHLAIVSSMLGACTLQPTQTSEPALSATSPTQTALVATNPPEVSATLAVDCHPVTIQPSRSLEPVFVETVKSTLMLQVGGQPPVPVGEFPDLGGIKDSLIIEDTLYLLRETGIQRIQLSDCTNDTLVELNHSVMSGSLLLASGGQRLFYATVDGTTRESIAGYVDLKDSTSHEVFSYMEDELLTFALLGLTENGQGIYLLQHGQDPSLRKILIVDIKKAAVAGELTIEGYGEADLSPDGSMLAVNNQVVDASDPKYPVYYQLNIYNLTAPSGTPPKAFDYPNAPSELGYGRILWSPDGQRAYFLVIDSAYEPTTAYGLWSLDVASGSMTKVAAMPDPTLHASTISPDGAWILLRAETKDETFQVNSQTGEVKLFSASVEAILTGWQ